MAKPKKKVNEECKHVWHLAKFYSHPFGGYHSATFVCSECGTLRNLPKPNNIINMLREN